MSSPSVVDLLQQAYHNGEAESHAEVQYLGKTFGISVNVEAEGKIQAWTETDAKHSSVGLDANEFSSFEQLQAELDAWVEQRA